MRYHYSITTSYIAIYCPLAYHLYRIIKYDHETPCIYTILASQIATCIIICIQLCIVSVYVNSYCFLLVYQLQFTANRYSLLYIRNHNLFYSYSCVHVPCQNGHIILYRVAKHEQLYYTYDFWSCQQISEAACRCICRVFQNLQAIIGCKQ